MRVTLGLLTAASVIALCISSEADAQTAATPAAAQVGGAQAGSGTPVDPGSQADSGTQAGSETKAEPTSGLADIIVTATRRSANLQRVPTTVSALPAATLEAAGIKSTIDLPALVPGLQIQRLAGVIPYLRGVGTSNLGYSTEMPVAIYVDGVYLPNGSSAVFSFNNIERIEVLKGPQGTLYGRNSTGGLIHVITKEPSSAPAADFSASYANYDTLTLNAYGSISVSGTVAANLAVLYTNQGDGWGRNVFTGRDTMRTKEQGFSGKIVWRPGPQTTVSLRGYYDHNDSDKGIVFAIVPGRFGVDGTGYLGRYRSASRTNAYSRINQGNISLKLDQELGFANLTSTTAFQKFRQHILFSSSGIPGNAVRGQNASETDLKPRNETWSQEIQLTSSPSGSIFSWVAGLFYYHDTLDVDSTTIGTCVSGLCVGPVPALITSRQTTESYSGYVDATVSATETTRITAGIRYTDDRKTLSGDTVPVAGYLNSVVTLPATTVVRPGQPFTGFPNGIPTSAPAGKVTFRGVIAQDLASDIHAYASFNRGFKSGGFNPIAFNNPPSNPETLDAYEIGVKSEFLRHKLRLNVAAFHYDYKDIQLRTTAPPAPPGAAILFNAGRARIKGVDVDFDARLAKGLTVSGGVEYLDAYFSSFVGGTCTSPAPIGGAILGGVVARPCDLSGRRLPSASKFSYNVAASYVLQTSFGSVTLNAGDSYKSAYTLTFDGFPRQSGYHLLGASASWKSDDDHYRIQLWAKNITGSYYLAYGAAQVNNYLYSPGEPRTYGVTLGYHY